MDTKTRYLCINNLPKEIQVCPQMCLKSLNFVALELIFKTHARSDTSTELLRSLKYKNSPLCRSFGVDMMAEKELIFI